MVVESVTSIHRAGADIVLTDGWIRAFYSWYDDRPTEIAQSLTPETLVWLEAHPEWDPRIQLLPSGERAAALPTPGPLLSPCMPAPPASAIRAGPAGAPSPSWSKHSRAHRCSATATSGLLPMRWP
jgi:hypothetical protein